MKVPVNQAKSVIKYPYLMIVRSFDQHAFFNNV
jgi:hypothetical protein